MCTSCSKCVLILFNILTAIIGAALLALGLIIRLGQNHIEWIHETIIPLLQRVILGNGSSVSFATLLDALTLGIIIVGSILLGISLIGLIGACCESECMLIMYAVFLGIIILAEAASIGVFFIYKDKVVATLSESLKGTIKGYTGSEDALDGGNQITAAWNKLQTEFQCCGAVSYRDYEEATVWRKDPPNQVVPVSCCQPNNPKCSIGQSSSSIYQQNCVDSLLAFLKKNDLIVGLVLAGIFGIEVVLFGMSCAIACESRRKK